MIIDHLSIDVARTDADDAHVPDAAVDDLQAAVLLQQVAAQEKSLIRKIHNSKKIDKNAHNSLGETDDIHSGADGVRERENQTNSAAKFWAQRARNHEVRAT